MRPEEKLHRAIWSALDEASQEKLATPDNEWVLIGCYSPERKRAVQALVKAGAIKVVNRKLRSMLSALRALQEMQGVEEEVVGYYIDTIEPRYTEVLDFYYDNIGKRDEGLIKTDVEKVTSQAKLENDNKAVNVKRGLRTRCEMGWRPGVAPTGYLNEKHIDKKCQCRIDPKRGPIIKQMFEKVAHEQWSGRKLYRWLREIDFKTHRGKPLVLANVYIILRNPFYYGDFEYPVGGGQWYTGRHTPIIDKELYTKVQMTLNANFIPKTESKEFAFTKLVRCGHCGSGISADEKFKKLKDGGVNRHVYYFCTKARNIDCKNPPINEPSLIEELIGLMDTVDLDELGIRTRIEDEIKRFNKFRSGVLGHKQDKVEIDVDVRNYTKYLLKEGTIIEKRELLGCLQSKLFLKDKKIELA